MLPGVQGFSEFKPICAGKAMATVGLAGHDEGELRKKIQHRGALL